MTRPPGEPQVEPQATPWQSFDPNVIGKLHRGLRPMEPQPLLVLGCAILVVFFAMTNGSPFWAALGAVVAAPIAVSWYFVCRRQVSFVVRVSVSFARVVERSPLPLQLMVENSSRFSVGPILVKCRFPGSLHCERRFLIPLLPPYGRRNLACDFVADRSMGEFQLEPVEIIYFDALGLYARRVTHDVEFTAEVVPEDINIPDLVVAAVGLTMHSGVSESRRSGDSATFLGLRPYLMGDSIRRIDWKRSQRFSQLVVREYERLNSTDATILVDCRHVARFEFAALNTFEILRDTAIALARNLLDQQIRVQIWAGDMHLPFGKGRWQLEWIRDTVGELEPTSDVDIVETINQIAPTIPPDSVFVLIFVHAAVDLAQLAMTFFALHERRVDVIPVLIDAEGFTAAIGKTARFTAEQYRMINTTRALHTEKYGNTADRFVEQLSERAIWIGPNESIDSVFAKDHAWRKEHRYR